ncbi:MAG: DUF4215 domain-containing protein [Myxococcota bacterium]
MSSLIFGVACGDDDGGGTDAEVEMGAEAGAEGGVEMGMEMTVPDPCAGINPARVCDAESVTCEGENLVVCAATPTGCITRTTMDCTSVPGGSCDATGATPMCVADPCADIEQCDAEARSCTDDTLTVCAADANGCLVETVTDCAADGTICDDSGDTPACVDECDGVSDCDAEGRSCDGETLTVCAPDENGCLVTETTDCAADGGSCDAAGDPVACLPPLCPPAAEFDTALNCASGTITGNTEGGTTFLSSYSCGFTNYPGPENVYTFSDAAASTVTITAVRTTSTLDMDLYVLPGDAVCGPTTDCLDDSTGTTDTETVEFEYIPGSEALVVYDVFGTAGGTAEYTLTVSCEEVTCGDGTIEGPETCEDGNTDNGDGCSEFCVIEAGFLCEIVDDVSVCAPSCGDGVLNGADECDDMNDVDGDGCTACVIDDGFLCDDSEPSVCAPSCGDGEVNGDDECDDMNDVDGDGCTACVVDAGFVCDDSEPSVCAPSCGDGLVNGDDECDDLNDVDGDGCTACVVDEDFACRGAPSLCGSVVSSLDGVLEDTDTAWTRPLATCGAGSTSTVFESVTYTNDTGGDIVVDIVADWTFDGYLFVYDADVDGDDPTTGCVVGNDDFPSGNEDNSGITGVEIADGDSIVIVASSFGAAGRGEFSITISEAVDGCGNGVINGSEECDDSGTTGAGCAADCTIEDGFICDVTDFVSTCIMPVCGNDMVEPGEVCDDGNTDDDDGCQGDCQSAVFTGSLLAAEDMSFQRLNTTCTEAGVDAGDYLYDVVSFNWAGAMDTSLRGVVSWAPSFDGFVHVYDSAFDPAMPLDRCIDGGDGFTTDTAGPFPATAGADYDFVISTFDPDTEGNWTLTITRE